jgi:DNA-binding NarL/FixJ family response regulator
MRADRIGLVNLTLDESGVFPEAALGFLVSWRSAPSGVRKAMRRTVVTGVVVECDSPSVDAAAAVLGSIEKEERGFPVWITLASTEMIILTRVVGAFRLEGDAETDVEVLTPRELEVLGLIRRGLTNQSIGAELKISISTVKRHVEHVLIKLAVRNRAQAAGRLRVRRGERQRGGAPPAPPR